MAASSGSVATARSKNKRPFELLSDLAHPDMRGMPKYIRLQEALVDAITSGHLKAGQRLPTEKELAASTRLSVGTVQRALRGLVDQGLVFRHQGLASFVADTQRQMKDPWHCRFLDDNGTDVLPVYSKALKRQLTKGQGAWTRYLGTGRIIRIDRRINIGGEFDVHGRFYASRDLLGYFWDCPFAELNGTSFRKLITRECKLPITHITHDLKVMTFGADICKSLNLKPPSTGLFVCAVARAGRDQCIYYQEFFMPPTSRFLHLSEGYDASAHLAGAA